MRVLQLDRDSDISAKRTGVFTSGIVSIAAGYRIALYFTGCKHAGENLAQVLKHRAAGLEPPIQMCDALSRNLPKSFQTILANCSAHGRRKFIKPNRPCRVLWCDPSAPSWQLDSRFRESVPDR